MDIRNIQDMRELLLDLERRVKIVRSARIEAAKRYRSQDAYYKFITIFYSIVITTLSVRYAVTESIGIKSVKTIFTNLPLTLLACSVFITLFTMYVSNKNYGEKVSKFQSNYMELTRLHLDIQRYIIEMKLNKTAFERDKEKHDEFGDRYSALLAQSENHDDIDYHKAIIREGIDSTDLENSKQKIKKAELYIKKYNSNNNIRRRVALFSGVFMLLLIEGLKYFL